MNRTRHSTRRRRRLVAASFAIFISISMVACTPPTTSKGASDEIILGRAMDVTTLDPSRSLCDSCQIYNAAVYDSLLSAPSADGKLQPLIAESWEANDRNTEFTFNLNEKAVFADGSAIEAKDVKWSWERLKGLEGSPSFFMDGVKSIEAPDEHTVVVTTVEPNSAFFNIVSAGYTGIINSDLAIKNGAGLDAESDEAEQWFLSNSAGSGQYELASYKEGSVLKLEKNENYWSKKPNFSKVTIKDVPDSSTQLQQLQQGDIDVAMQLSFDALDQVENDQNIDSEVVPSYNFVYVAFSPGADGADPALKDPKVREAIRTGIDYDSVIESTVAGQGKRQSTGIPNGFEGSEGLPVPGRDAEAAKAMLAEAGYDDGLTLEASYPNFTIYGVDFNTMFQSVQQSLSEIGVDLSLTPMEYSAWSQKLADGGIPVTGVYYAPDHPDTIQYSQYFSLATGSVWKERSGMPENTKATELQRTAMSQRGEERTESYSKIGQLMYDDAIVLPIVNPNIILASGPGVEGNNYHVTRNIDLRELSFTK